MKLNLTILKHYTYNSQQQQQQQKLWIPFNDMLLFEMWYKKMISLRFSDTDNERLKAVDANQIAVIKIRSFPTDADEYPCMWCYHNKHTKLLTKS